MSEELTQAEALSPEVQEVMRSLVSAIRAVKLYPPNNPVYSQSVKKSYDALDHFLAGSPDYNVGVQKVNFTYMHTPIGKDAQLNKTIAQDLYAKGIREIVFSAGLTEEELLDFYRILALSPEELAIKNGISSILWERASSHIKVVESGLDEVIKTIAESEWGATSKTASSRGAEPDREKKADAPSKTLVMGDLINDPSGFGNSMLELAKQTKAEHESVEDRLFTLYQEAGRGIRQEHPSRIEVLFESLAKSAMSLEQPYRDGLIGGKLYGDMDADLAAEEEPELGNQLPNVLQEIQTGRFSNAWTIQQVATLLKKSSSKNIVTSTPPVSAASLVAVPIPNDLDDIARQLSEYTPEEMIELQTLSDGGREKDILESSIRTLIHLIPVVKNPQHSEPSEQEIKFFSGIVHQLDELLTYHVSKKEYGQAAKIIRAFQTPVEPVFRQRMTDALKKAGSKKTDIIDAIRELRKNSKNSPEYANAYAYISLLERGTTGVLLELMAQEDDRSARIFYLDLVRDIGKNQITLLGERISDGRWYFVRNIVSILSESKTDQAVAILRRAADHPNVKIRQEVIKSLFTIGGKKAASVLVKFLRDQNEDVQITAIRALADFPGIGAEESAPLAEYLNGRGLKKKGQELTLEAIRALGRIGGRDAAEFLKSYTKFRWWKSRKLQRELREAADKSIEEILRREDSGRKP